MTDVAERCLLLIAKLKSVPVETLQLSQTLEELQFDSLDKVTLVFDIEEEFQISITDEDLARLRTLGDIVCGVIKRTANEPGQTEIVT